MTALARIPVFFGVFFFSIGVGKSQGLLNRLPIAPFLNEAFPETTPQVDTGGAVTYTTVEPFPDLEINAFDLIQLIPVPNSNHLLLADKRGKIFTFENNPGVTSLTELIDLQPTTQWDGDSGLLGVALHPAYGQGVGKDHVFVYYRYRPFEPGEIEGGAGVDENGEPNNQKAYMRLSRFTWSPGSEAIVSPEVVLINQYDPHNWHNGGGLAFGSDGFLYITVGDAGGADDEFNTTQSLEGGLFSGVLRIDVDEDASRSHPIRRQPLDPVPRPDSTRFIEETYTANYYIPNDNPWQDEGGGILEEFYALGLRSPHRMTYDRETGQFWIGDVG